MFCTATLLLLGLGSEAPAPDYRSELGARYAAELRQGAARDGSDAAMKRAAEIESHVGPLLEVRYEAALARNQAGAIRPAIEAYGRVLALNPDHVVAVYVRGELWLVAVSPADIY